MGDEEREGRRRREETKLRPFHPSSPFFSHFEVESVWEKNSTWTQPQSLSSLLPGLERISL